MNEIWALWGAGFGSLVFCWGFLLTARGWVRYLSGTPITLWQAIKLQVIWTVSFFIWCIKFIGFLLFAIPTAVLAAYFWWLVGTETALVACLVVLLMFTPYWMSGLAEICRALGSKHPWVSSINVCLVLSSAVILKALIFRPEGKVMIPGWERALIVGFVLSSILFLINKIWIVSRPRSYFSGS